VRLRVELDDRPGALAAVAAAIAARDGNITAIDVLEAEDGRVVDEITVDAPADLDMALLRVEIAGLQDARVLSHQRAELRDPIVRVLRGLAAAAEHQTEGGREELRRAVADLCATPAVAVVDAGNAGGHDLGRQALADPGRAAIGRGPDDLPFLGEVITGDASVVAVATTLSSGPVVVVVARPLAQGFTPTECERIEALVDVYSRLR
jgi:hypothetical protein